ncbi:hypothetical protein VULLAG_LOCUS19391 [Vulpes lagopus]
MLLVCPLEHKFYDTSCDLVTAARALMTTWSDCHHGLPTGLPAGLLHCLQLVWNAVAHPLSGIFNEEQTLFWSGTAEKQGTDGRCCFWQK